MMIHDDSPDANIKKNRPLKWPKLEEAMTIWIERIFLGNQDIAVLYRIQRVMELKYIESLKQKTLDSYVSKAN